MVATATTREYSAIGVKDNHTFWRAVCAHRHCNVAIGPSIYIFLQQFLESSSIGDDEARKVRSIRINGAVCVSLEVRALLPLEKQRGMVDEV